MGGEGRGWWEQSSTFVRGDYDSKNKLKNINDIPQKYI